MTRKSDGFTLLELLVALVVLSFVIFGLAQGVRFGVTAWGTQARMISERGELDAVDRALRRLIERMEPGQQKEPARIEGKLNYLAFISELPAVASTGIRQADIAILVSGGRLLLRWAPHQHAQRLGAPPPLAEAELLRGVEQVEFAYWPQGGPWASAWAERVLPALVRIRIVFPRGDRRRWPDIIAAPLQERAGA